MDFLALPHKLKQTDTSKMLAVVEEFKVCCVPDAFSSTFQPLERVIYPHGHPFLTSIHSRTHCILDSALIMLADCPDSPKQLNFQIPFSPSSEYFVQVSSCLHPYSQCLKLRPSCLFTMVLCLVFLRLLSLLFPVTQLYSF